MSPTLDLRPERYDSPAVVALTAQVQRFYAEIYGEPDSTPFTADDFAPPRGGFLVGYSDDRPMAMGGWRFTPYAAPAGARRAAEIKRMYVADTARGRGFAKALLTALEDGARAAGADWMVLETGQPQVAAVGLYRAQGYGDVAPYGYYAGHAGVISLGKRLRRPHPGYVEGMADDTKKIAFLVAAEGIEAAELTEPWAAAADAGLQPVLVSPEEGTVQLFEHLDRSETRPVDLTVAQASVDDFAALVLPGGVANPDALRMDADAVALVKAFVESGRPVAAICHAPWTLIEADVLRGRRLTSWPSLTTDIRNAGGDWVDEPVVVDGNLITSRNPDDLPAFISALLEAVNHGVSSAAASVS